MYPALVSCACDTIQCDMKLIFCFLVLILRSWTVPGELQNYYSVLGINKDASSEEIKQAYRKMAKKWHPDKNSDPKAPEKFLAVSEAYEHLGTDSARATYDASLSTQHYSRHAQRTGFNSFNSRRYEFRDVRYFFDEMEKTKKGHRNNGGFQFSASYSSNIRMIDVLKLFVFFGLLWVFCLGSVCYLCCGKKSGSEIVKKEETTDLSKEIKYEIPSYSYSMKLRKGYLVVACSSRTLAVLQDIADSGKFKNDPVSFAHKLGPREVRGVSGDIYGVILVCLKGNKWAGHTIIDTDLSTWIEKVLCGEVPLIPSGLEPCPV